MIVAAIFLASLAGLLAGCGDDGEGTLAPARPAPGVSVYFDLEADWNQPANFYAVPYPMDGRFDGNGAPALDGLPAPPGNALVRSLKSVVPRRRGFPTVASAYFRFDGPLAPRSLSEILLPVPDAPVLLLDTDPQSPERGRLFPVVAQTLPQDPYTPPNLLAVAAVPGVILRPKRTYAFVIQRSLAAADGSRLGVPAAVADLLNGVLPPGERGAALRELFEPLALTLREAGISLDRVAAATVFTTGDEVARLAELVAKTRSSYAVEVEGLRIDADDGASHDRFCELHGYMRAPQFQSGGPPFDRDGLLVLDPEGVPVAQRTEIAPVAITLPRQPMPPDGYPVVMYIHGTGGLSTQVVDRGRTAAPGAQPEKGKGPAYELALRGFATASMALPLNPERLPGTSGRTYLNFNNLAAYPSTVWQTVLEQALLLDALERLQIAPEVVRACGLPVPPESDSYRLRSRPMYLMGQSFGAQVANMLGAVDARITALVPTGSGGLWPLTVLEAEIAPGLPSPTLVATLLQTPRQPTFVHPGLMLLETVFEAADPIAFAPRLARFPLPGHPARSLYLPVGAEDPDFPEPIYDAMALASGVEQAGEPLWETMQQSLSVTGLAGIRPYPVRENRRSEDGRQYTGVVVQYRPDGILSGHHIFAQLDTVKFQYGCFFASAELGSPVVFAPSDAAAPCPVATTQSPVE